MVTVFLTGPLYRGNTEDLKALVDAKALIESSGDYKVLSVHELNEGLSPEEAKCNDTIFRKRLEFIKQADLMVALDSFEQETLCKMEVNYLRASYHKVMTMSALLAKHQQVTSA